MGAGDAASAVHVIVRVRPQNQLETSKGGQVAVECLPTEVRVESGYDGQSPDGGSRFTFDTVFAPESSQEDVFDRIGRPLVENVFLGYNGTIFAYGQTSSGKTHTMQGPDINDPKLAGVIPRTVRAIFETIAAASEDMEFTVRASYVEIYLERIRDLLDPSRQNLQVREDPNKRVYVEGMSERYVNSIEEMMELMALGSNNRVSAATGMNEGSSRSHSVFILQLVQTDTKSGTTKTSKINLVDLAGSEMVRKTGATGDRLDEAKRINLSLSALGKVINALTDGKSTHIPYRDSKLTRMLQESLGGNARTWLVINVSPSSFNAQETLSTLRFGSRAKAIQNKAVVNQARTVEELEALLQKAEKAIDIQAKYIDKLTAKLAGATENTHATNESSPSGEIPPVAPVADDVSPKRILELEAKLKEVEEARANDAETLESSLAEISMLYETLKTKTQNLEDANSSSEQHLIQIASLTEKLDSATREQEATKFSLDETTASYEHRLHEMQVKILELESENKRLCKELESVPPQQPTSSTAKGHASSKFAGATDLEEATSDEEKVSILKRINREMQQEFTASENSYKSTIKDLRAKLEAAGMNFETASPSDRSTSSVEMNQVYEQRLYQLIAAHKQVLKKYAHAELAAVEKNSVLVLKEERIRLLEGNLKNKDFTAKSMAQRHKLELEEHTIEHQREIQELQAELSKLRRELKSQSSSFGTRIGAYMTNKRHSPKENIRKPLKGGGSTTAPSSSGVALGSDSTLKEREVQRGAGGKPSEAPSSGASLLGWLSPSRMSNSTNTDT
mmetsp:Transcript_19/g.32  ORF Transcript_19/g.32 Transcript_19/m.32 type:complete len:797 (-) Transcript_19:150-2540(-)